MVSALLGALSGNTMLEQIIAWQIVGALVSSAFQPALAEVSQQSWGKFPLAVLSPAELASAVVRNFAAEDAAAGEAEQSGISRERFATLVRLSGQSLAPDALAVALRRKLIPEDSGSPDAPGFVQGIAQGNLRDMWAPVVKALAVQLPSPTLALSAYLEGQLPEAEARAMYAVLGGDPDYFDVSYNTEGQAPTPTQALDLLNRGIIPERGTGPEATSYEQAFLEGPWRNKWLEPFLALREYLPPPRTITAMLKTGSLTPDQATSYLMKNGLSAELAAAYVADASHQALAGTKDLALGTVRELYRDRLIDAPTASSMIQSLGYSADSAAFVLAIEDVRFEQAALTSAVSRVRTLYTSYKRDRVTTLNVLSQLGIAGDQAASLMGVWDLERAANIKTLTEAQIVAAFHYGVIDQATAQTELVTLGYLPHDAWTLLSVREHGPLPDEPPLSALPPAASPTGG